MKSSFLFSLTISIFLLASACSSENQGKIDPIIQETIDSLKIIYAPDSRVARIEVEVLQNGKTLVINGESNVTEFQKELLTRLQGLGYETIDSIAQLPQAALGEKNWALINVSVANLRGQAGHSKELVTQALMGTPVKVLKKEGGWYFIQTPDMYLSWTEEASIIRLSEKELKEWNRRDKVILTHDYSIIRETKDTFSPAVSDIVIGGIVNRISSAGGFYEVMLPDGRLGFLKNADCQDFLLWKFAIKPVPDQFIRLGFEMLGRPYLWGGTSSKGMDCSGFVKTLYASGGMILPRDASQQVFIGELVDTEKDFSNLIKGDLLFFGRKASANKAERISHVGMYIGGDKYIHSSGKVKLNSFNPDDEIYSEYLKDIFVRAKRIINNTSGVSASEISSHPWYN